MFLKEKTQYLSAFQILNKGDKEQLRCASTQKKKKTVVMVLSFTPLWAFHFCKLQIIMTREQHIFYIVSWLVSLLDMWILPLGAI